MNQVQHACAAQTACTGTSHWHMRLQQAAQVALRAHRLLPELPYFAGAQIAAGQQPVTVLEVRKDYLRVVASSMQSDILQRSGPGVPLPPPLPGLTAPAWIDLAHSSVAGCILASTDLAVLQAEIDLAQASLGQRGRACQGRPFSSCSFVSVTCTADMHWRMDFCNQTSTYDRQIQVCFIASRH